MNVTKAVRKIKTTKVVITSKDLLSHLPLKNNSKISNGSGILQPDEVNDKPRTPKQKQEEEETHNYSFDDNVTPLEEEHPLEIFNSDLEPKEEEEEDDEDEDDLDEEDDEDDEDNYYDEGNYYDAEDEDENEEPEEREEEQELVTNDQN